MGVRWWGGAVEGRASCVKGGKGGGAHSSALPQHNTSANPPPHTHTHTHTHDPHPTHLHQHVLHKALCALHRNVNHRLRVPGRAVHAARQGDQHLLQAGRQAGRQQGNGTIN